MDLNRPREERYSHREGKYIALEPHVEDIRFSKLFNFSLFRCFTLLVQSCVSSERYCEWVVWYSTEGFLVLMDDTFFSIHTELKAWADYFTEYAFSFYLFFETNREERNLGIKLSLSMFSLRFDFYCHQKATLKCSRKFSLTLLPSEWKLLNVLFNSIRLFIMLPRGPQGYHILLHKTIIRAFSPSQEPAADYETIRQRRPPRVTSGRVFHLSLSGERSYLRLSSHSPSIENYWGTRLWWRWRAKTFGERNTWTTKHGIPSTLSSLSHSLSFLLLLWIGLPIELFLSLMHPMSQRRESSIQERQKYVVCSFYEEERLQRLRCSRMELSILRGEENCMEVMEKKSWTGKRTVSDGAFLKQEKTSEKHPRFLKSAGENFSCITRL